MVYLAEQCAKNAEADKSNAPGYCLQQTREWCGIAARYGDAATAWANTNTRHPGDRHPPRGAPVYWTGGSHGYGHIALSLGGGKIRSTDAAGSGKVATVDLAWPEQHWGLRFAGWAWDINEVTIPHDEGPPPNELTADDRAWLTGLLTQTVEGWFARRAGAHEDGETVRQFDLNADLSPTNPITTDTKRNALRASTGSRP